MAPERRGTRAAAVGLGAALLGWSATKGLRIPGRRHPLTQVAVGSTLALLTRAPLGVRGPHLAAGARWGVAGAAAVAAGVAATTALPPVREAMAARDLPAPLWRWLLVDIPLGTVLSEEAAYRAALHTVAEAGFGPRAGSALQAAVFGLSHVPDARATGEPVLGTVLVTGAAGWMFAWLRRRSGSTLAPALAHLAVNEAGAVAAAVVQRRRSRQAQSS